MTTYQRFEDLPVWQESADLAAKMFDWSHHAVFRGKGDLADQIQRAALSISNNIAEGFERGSGTELIQSLCVARGSAGEVRSMLSVINRMTERRDVRAEISALQSTCENISRQIRAWIDHLQNRTTKGQRHLNEESKRNRHRRRVRNEFIAELDEFRTQMENAQNEKPPSLRTKSGTER